jgi:hypothetical protein
MKHLARVLATAVAVWLAAAPSAQADMTKDQCVDANAKGQDLRHDGKLTLARAAFVSCTNVKCPAIVRDDCTRRLDELDHAQPSVVFQVKDRAGADVIDVRISMDGTLLTEHLNGTPLKVDPGIHVFSFEVAGQPAVSSNLLIREGEAARHESVVVGAAAAPPVPPAPVSPAAPRHATLPRQTDAAAPGGQGKRTQRTVGLVVGGAGVVAIGVGAIFGLLATSAWSDAKGACAGNALACADVASASAHHDTAVTDGMISTVSFIAGGALLAGGAVLFFSARRTEAPPSKSISIVPTAGYGQAGLALTGAL